MSKHTPGPWTIKHGYVVSGGITVAKVLQSTGPADEYEDRTPIENHAANAERIVACVNAMDGIEDPEHFRITGGQMSMSNETRSLLLWAEATNWRSLDTNLAKAVDRWKKAGCPDLPKGLF